MIGSRDALLGDDLIGRVRGQVACRGRVAMDGCSSHDGPWCFHAVNSEDLGWWRQKRAISHCPSCRPDGLPSGDTPRQASVATVLTDGKTVRRDWNEYFFAIAREVSTRATCPRARIGVVLVSHDHRIISTGFNGAAPGEPHCDQEGCILFPPDATETHCVRAVHAEVNAVEGAFKLVEALADWSLFKTSEDWEHRFDGLLAKLEPTAYVVGPRSICSHCARTLHRAGVLDVKTRQA